MVAASAHVAVVAVIAVGAVDPVAVAEPTAGRTGSWCLTPPAVVVVVALVVGCILGCVLYSHPEVWSVYVFREVEPSKVYTGPSTRPCG